MKARLHLPAILWIAGLVIAACTSLWAGAIQAQATPTVFTRPEITTIAPGAGRTIEIWVKDVNDLYGVDLKIRFDPAIVEVRDSDPDRVGIQIEPGSFLSPATGFIAMNEVNPATGEIRYAMTEVNPAPPVSGTGVIVRVTFRGRAEGQSAITLLDVKLADRNAEPIAAQVVNGQVVVQGTAPVSPSATPKPQPSLPPGISPTRTPITVAAADMPDSSQPPPASPEQPASPLADNLPPLSPTVLPAGASGLTPQPPPVTGPIQRQFPSPPAAPRTAQPAPGPSPLAAQPSMVATGTGAGPTEAAKATPDASVPEERAPVTPGSVTTQVAPQTSLSPLVSAGVALVCLAMAWLWWQHEKG